MLCDGTYVGGKQDVGFQIPSGCSNGSVEGARNLILIRSLSALCDSCVCGNDVSWDENAPLPVDVLDSEGELVLLSFEFKFAQRWIYHESVCFATELANLAFRNIEADDCST
jgi:hypothetical protein